METFFRDMQFAARRLRLAPAFALFAVASLALGIGVSTAIYSAVRTLLWMPLGIGQPIVGEPRSARPELGRPLVLPAKKRLLQYNFGHAGFFPWRACRVLGFYME